MKNNSQSASRILLAPLPGLCRRTFFVCLSYIALFFFRFHLPWLSGALACGACLPGQEFRPQIKSYPSPCSMPAVCGVKFLQKNHLLAFFVFSQLLWNEEKYFFLDFWYFFAVPVWRKLKLPWFLIFCGSCVILARTPTNQPTNNRISFFFIFRTIILFFLLGSKSTFLFFPNRAHTI